jgi:hypothetical protein
MSFYAVTLQAFAAVVDPTVPIPEHHWTTVQTLAKDFLDDWLRSHGRDNLAVEAALERWASLRPKYV